MCLKQMKTSGEVKLGFNIAQTLSLSAAKVNASQLDLISNIVGTRGKMNLN
jgi:hypothetical protein